MQAARRGRAGGRPERGEIRALRSLRSSTAVLFPEEPVGTVITRTPEAVALHARLAWDEPDEEICLPDPIPNLDDRKVRVASVWNADPEATCCFFSCVIRGFGRTGVSRALDEALRSVTSFAAVTEAVLEVRTVCLARARVFRGGARWEVEHALRETGFEVRTSSSWVPASVQAAVCLGARGAEDEIESLLRGRGWEICRVWNPQPLRGKLGKRMELFAEQPCREGAL